MIVMMRNRRPVVAGRVIVEREGGYIPVPEDEITDSDRIVNPFRFLPVSVFVDKNARVLYEESSKSPLIRRHEVADGERYGRIMTAVTLFLIGDVLSPCR